MNKSIATKVLGSFVIVITMASAMVTNTNQSADYIRMMNRNASTDLDAVLFNPAGLSLLDNGTYLYVSTQTIWQTRKVSVFDNVYNKESYTGETFVPVFPNFYFARKQNNVTLFGGFMPIGGGGSASFDDGLPAFDELLANLVGTSGITEYSMEAEFTGSSVYYAGQLGVAYKLNPMVSLAVAFRYISAVNTYEGTLKDAAIYMGSTKITHNESSSIPGDIIVDSKRTGTGYTTVLSVDLKPSDKMNIGLRFEPMTKLTLESETTKDDTKGVVDSVGMFPDDVTYHEDIPGQIGAGLSYWLTPAIRAELGFNYWLNSAVDWDGAEENVVNDFNTGFGLEYSISDAMLLSCGYLFSTTGAKDSYNTDMDFSLGSQTIGAGAKYVFSPALQLSLGVSNTFYQTGKNDKVNPFFKQEYDKTAFVIALGIQYKL